MSINVSQKVALGILIELYNYIYLILLYHEKPVVKLSTKLCTWTKNEKDYIKPKFNLESFYPVTIYSRKKIDLQTVVCSIGCL